MFSWITTHPIAYPALEVVHIFGIALLVGNLVLLETRVWGLNTALPLEGLARATLTLSFAGFTLVAASGLVMFSSQPLDLIANRFFAIKMGLLTIVGINAAVFHTRGGLRRIDAIAKVQTALSLGLWIGVMICGRWIGYA